MAGAFMQVLPDGVEAAAYASAMLFLRELTQEQAKHYQNNFLRGWNFFRWSAGKNFETWLPIATVMLAGVWVSV